MNNEEIKRLENHLNKRLDRLHTEIKNVFRNLYGWAIVVIILGCVSLLIAWRWIISVASYQKEANMSKVKWAFIVAAIVTAIAAFLFGLMIGDMLVSIKECMSCSV